MLTIKNGLLQKACLLYSVAGVADGSSSIVMKIPVKSKLGPLANYSPLQYKAGRHTCMITTAQRSASFVCLPCRKTNNVYPLCGASFLGMSTLYTSPWNKNYTQ